VKIVFGPFVLDIDTRQLTTAERERHLSTKAFDLLVTLVHERPRVVTKAELQQRLWPDTFVDEANVANLVAEIRDALGDSPRDALFIRTIHRVGYAFCAEAQPVQPTVEHGAESPACWLEWDAQRFLLAIGEHVIGRDADVAVSLDDSTVSRRHARLVVTAERMMLEDLGSKNGTFCNGTRVASPIALVNRDIVGIGSVRLTFRLPAPVGSTETRAIEASS
jgi:DNA-binding winged helix-turn-helix (wHTH) protein